MKVGAGHEGRGAFIVFEGCDRSGKTTQSKKLVAALREKGVRYLEKGTKFGKKRTRNRSCKGHPFLSK